MNPPELLIDYNEVLNRIKQIDPVKYAQTRDSLNSLTTNLSPFITHGIISTKTVANLAQTGWPGSRDKREWVYPQAIGYFKNFFSFWEESQKEIKGLKSLHEPCKES